MEEFGCPASASRYRHTVYAEWAEMETAGGGLLIQKRLSLHTILSYCSIYSPASLKQVRNTSDLRTTGLMFP